METGKRMDADEGEPAQGEVRQVQEEASRTQAGEVLAKVQRVQQEDAQRVEKEENEDIVMAYSPPRSD